MTVGTAEIGDAAEAAAANIIVSMTVGTGIIAADKSLILLHHLHHLRVVGLLQDHLPMIGEEKRGTTGAVEMILDAVTTVVEVREVVVPQLMMYTPTSKGVARKRHPSLQPLLQEIQTNHSVFGTASNGLYVLHNSYRQLTCK